MVDEPLAGRAYIPRAYRVAGRRDVHDFLSRAIEQSGGRIAYASPPTRAPFVFGVQTARDDRLCLVVYAFRCNPAPIKGRPSDEHRVQVRYGGQPSWGGSHRIAQDPAGADTVLVVGAHLGAGVLVGLDPLLYDPLPMGISVEFKQDQVDAALTEGWCVWERDNISGLRRPDPRSENRLETLVGLAPDRLLDYAEFERQATGLGLDPPLRHRAAVAAAERCEEPTASTVHRLEREFALPAAEILEIVAERRRLGVALRGGVAEHHLARHLRTLGGVAEVVPIDEDGRHDFDVHLTGGRGVIRLECKNCSPAPFADGTAKVEVQKTRASKDDPASRYYRVGQFDVVAACLYPATGYWHFRFKHAAELDRREDYPDRIAPIQRVDDTWVDDLADFL
jgi:hypothetical protein